MYHSKQCAAVHKSISRRAAKKNVVPSFLIALFISGCASTSPPSGWLPYAETLPEDVYGGWITVLYDVDRNGPILKSSDREAVTPVSQNLSRICGEFISQEQDSFHVLPRQGSALTLAKNRVVNVTLEIDEKESDLFAIWMIVGTLSTFTHGWFLFVTAPFWLINGSAIAILESNRDTFDEVRPTDFYWQNISKFARFPQGAPAGIDWTTLKQKPVRR